MPLTRRIRRMFRPRPGTAPTVLAPNVPGTLEVAAGSNARVDLEWGASPTDGSHDAATTYTIQRGPDGTTGWTTIGTTNGTTWSDTTVSAETTYWYRVKGSNTGGSGEYTGASGATTPARPESVAVVSFTLANTSDSDPVPLGAPWPMAHGFVAGDVPAGCHLEATFTPDGGEESARFPVQTDGARTWPDGSLAFTPMSFRAPVEIPPSGFGTVTLYPVAGEEDRTLPGGATIDGVLAELRANHIFKVEARNLVKGQPYLRVDSPGTGYSGYDAMSFTGGVGGSPIPSNQIRTVVGDYGVILGAGFTDSPTAFTVPPTVSIATSTGSGFAGTFVNPPLDGSGSHDWDADDHLALYGDVDGRGRVRCEVVAEGPNRVTFEAWGPVKDTVGGATHKHLCVKGWYDCYLDPDTGSIANLEYFHKSFQGWIGDLDGGSIAADMEIGDWTVKRNGATVPGRSWTRVRHPAHSDYPLMEINASETSANVHAGGSDWTAGSPTLRVRFDRQYLVRTGLIPPYDVAYFDAHTSGDLDEATPTTYAPGAAPDCGNMSYGEKAINNGGERGMIGVWPAWDNRSFLTDDPNSSIATAHYGLSLPISVRNPETGRIPNLLKSTTYSDPGANRLGTSRPTTYRTFYYFPQRTDDFAVVGPRYGWLGGINEQDHTNQVGGWGCTGWNFTHWWNSAEYAYFRTGRPWFLETVRMNANHCAMADFQDKPHPFSGGQPCERGWTPIAGEERKEAWYYNTIAAYLILAPDAEIERPYLQKLYDLNADQSANIIEIGNALTDGRYSRGGSWVFPYDYLPRDTRSFEGSPWMTDYIAHSRIREYLGLGKAPGSSVHKWLVHYANFMKGRAGGFPESPTSYFFANYRCWPAIGSDMDAYLDWSDMPHVVCGGSSIGGGVAFDAEAVATGWLRGYPPYDMVNAPIPGWDLRVGDGVLFNTTYQYQARPAPPPEVAIGKHYYIAAVDTGTGRFRISPNADLSDPFTSFSEEVSSVSQGIRFEGRDLPPEAMFQSDFGGVATGRAAVGKAVMNGLFLAGILDPDEPYVAGFDARMAVVEATYASPATFINQPKYNWVRSR